MKKITYSLDENNTLHIYDENNRIIADVSDCGNMDEIEIDKLIDNILWDLGYYSDANYNKGIDDDYERSWGPQDEI